MCSGGPAAHYLVQVMRAKPGDPVKLFDDATGEWLATVTDVARKSLTLDLSERLRAREPVPDLWLAAAPIKKGRIDWMAEKACELGVARYLPVLTRRTVADRVNTGRLRAHMVEAAEQCGRTAIPEVAEPVKLAALLRNWPADRALFFADEEGGAAAAHAMRAEARPGGNPDRSRGRLRRRRTRRDPRPGPNAVAITLGPRILRADTAAAAAVALWMAAAGDWA